MRRFQFVQNKLMRTGRNDGRAPDKISADCRPTTSFLLFVFPHSIESILTDAHRTITKSISTK